MTSPNPSHAVGAPMPAGGHLFRLAASLAQPVARGWLTQGSARDSLAAGTVRAMRQGKLGPYEPADVFEGLCFTLDVRLRSETDRRDRATQRIKRLVKPMIATRRPWGALMAEAHGVNGEADFPLTEEEVTEVVRTEVWWSLPTGGHRRG